MAADITGSEKTAVMTGMMPEPVNIPFMIQVVQKYRM